MAITKITVHCSDCSMGGEVSAADAAGYRVWLTEQLEKEYPSAEIRVTNENHTHSVCVSDGEGYNNTDDLYEVGGFVCHAWGRCNWEWVGAAKNAK